MKRPKILFVIAVALFFIAAIHTTGHFYIWGTGIRGFRETGISGLSVGKFSIGEDATGIYSIESSLSQLIVIGEWIAVLIFFVIAFARNKVHSREEFHDLKVSMNRMSGEHDTDLDKLYSILKERKRIGFGAIAKAFNVHGRVVHEWAKTLESGRFASIDYPRIGDPELVLTDK